MNVTGSANTPGYANYKVDSTKFVELGEFKVSTNVNTNRAVLTTALTVNNSGNSDLSYLSDVGLYRDDVKVSTKTTVGSKTITFVLSDEIKNTQSSATYVIKGKITNAERVNDTYHFYLRNKEDLTVIEKDSLFRANVAKGTETTSLVTVAGGDLRFNEGSISAQTVVPGSKTVVFYEGTLSSMEAINLEKLTVTGNNNSTLTGFDKVLQNLYVKIGNTVISAEAISGTGDQLFTFDGQATVNGTVPFSIYGDIKDDAPALKVSFNVDAINLEDFNTKEYVSNGNTVTSAIGSIGGKVITVTQADMTLSNNSSTTKNVQKGDHNVEIAKLEFGTTSDVVSKVYSFKATLSGSARQNFDGGSVTLYDEAGAALVSQTIATGSDPVNLTFVLPTALAVAKTTPLKFTVKLDQVANSVVVGNKMKLLFTGIIAKNIINQTYVGTTLSTNSTELTVVAGGTATEVTQSYTKKLVKAGTTAIVGSIKVKAFDGSVILKDFNVSLGSIDASKLSSITLLEDGVSIGTFTKTNGSPVLYVSGLNKTIDVGVTKTYEIQATFPTVNTSGDLLASFTTTLNTATFESVYGTGLVPLTGKTISSTILPVNEILTISAIDGLA